MTRVCVIGCGAIGSLFAGHLARLEDVEVFALDVSREHVDALNRSGLRLSGRADFTVAIRATTNSREVPSCDYGIVATKSNHTRSAIEGAQDLFGQESAVLSVQNGAGNEEIIAECVRYVMRGTTFPAGHVVEPGHIGYDIEGDTWIGPFEPCRTPIEKVRFLAEALTRAGMNTIALEDARGAQWTKLIFNAATNPVGALTGLHHGAASYFEPTARLFQDLIDEGRAVAEASGIELHGDPEEMVRKGAQAPGRHKASMLQDVEAKRPTEVDFLNGAIARYGKEAGVATPLNEAMFRLIRGLEHSWTDP